MGSYSGRIWFDRNSKLMHYFYQKMHINLVIEACQTWKPPAAEHVEAEVLKEKLSWCKLGKHFPFQLWWSLLNTLNSEEFKWKCLLSFDYPQIFEPQFCERLANRKKNTTTALQTALDLPRKTPCICSTEWSWDCTRWLSPPDAFTSDASHMSLSPFPSCPSIGSMDGKPVYNFTFKQSLMLNFSNFHFSITWDVKSIQSSMALLPHVTTLPSSRIAAKACDEAAISRTPWSWSCTKPQRLIAGAVSTHTEGAGCDHE